MKATATTVLAPLCAKDDTDAARMLGISRSCLWKLCNLPESDPRRIRKTSYGKIPVTELQRHLAAEMSKS